jgi:hypothetical protein
MIIAGCWLSGCLFHGAKAEPLAQNDKFRKIDIPPREHGYSSFDSQVIDNQATYEAFVATVRQQDSWNDKAAFLQALTDAKLNFDREALVLLRHTEGSGSIQVKLEKLTAKAKRLSCSIARQVPEIRTADMAYYCFALVVDKSGITEVELKVGDRRNVLSIPAAKPDPVN